MRVEPPTLAGIVDRMERDGWIVRRVLPGGPPQEAAAPTERVEPIWETIADGRPTGPRRGPAAGFAPEQVQN